MQKIKLRPAVKVSIIYLVVATAWIYLSDKLMLLLFVFKTHEEQMIYSIAKGLFYVAITSYLLYKLVNTYYRQIENRVIELQESELQIIQLNRLYSFISQINQLIVRSQNSESLFKEICQIAIQAGHFRMVWIGIVDEETGEVKPIAFAGNEDGYLNSINISIDPAKPGGNGPMANSIRNNKYFIANDIENDPLMIPWRKDALEREFRSCICIPILKFGKSIGAIGYYSSVKNFFKEEEINLLAEVTDDISYELENQEKEKQRVEAEAKLAKSEKNFRTIVETANEGIWQLGKNNKTIFINKRMAEMLGYTTEEIIGKSVFDFMDINSIEMAHKKLQERSWGKADIYELGFVHKNGNLVQTEIRTSSLFDKEEYIGPFAMITDITERKVAQEKIMEALDRYNIVSMATKDVIWEWDIQNKTVFYNQGITEIFGYPETISGENEEIAFGRIHPNDIKAIHEKIREAFQTKQNIITAEYRYRCMDSTYKNIKNHGFVIYNNNIPIRAIGAMQDVTVEREANMLIEKAVIDTQENEKHQMGMELHDNVNQLLSAAVIYLGILKKSEEHNTKSDGLLKKADHLIRQAIEEIRKLTHQLAPSTNADIPLQAVFRELVNTINADNSFHVSLNIDELDKKVLSPKLQTALYRILQEQLNNIIKHAGATEVNITLKRNNTFILFRIEDNGKGFDPAVKAEGIGLENMRRRIKLFSGEMLIESYPGNGCRLIIEIPTESVY